MIARLKIDSNLSSNRMASGGLVSEAVIDEALRAALPLLDRGYRRVHDRVDEHHFGSGLLLLIRNEARVRIVNDRGLWFVEIGSAAAPDEWFDARLVLMEIGDSPEIETDYESLTRLVRQLAETSPKWEVLFLAATFATARASLRSREIASAAERFDVRS
jgi:hypothetical protein